MGPLIAIPNVSEGRDHRRIDRIAAAFAGAEAALRDVHSDPDHNRSVYTLTAEPGSLSGAVVAGAAAAIDEIDIFAHAGLHPHIGAIDVAPIVHLDAASRGPACAEALVLADRLGEELRLPVFLYGLLGSGRTRAELRRGGPSELRRRMAEGQFRPDFGPSELHPTAGAVLVAARPPLIAFNVELAPPATVDDARAIAAAIREGGEAGMPGLRAIGLWCESRSVPQVSMNIEDYVNAPPGDVVAAIAARGAILEAELVGLAPAAALAQLPTGLTIRNRRTIEDALADTD